MLNFFILSNNSGLDDKSGIISVFSVVKFCSHPISQAGENHVSKKNTGKDTGTDRGSSHHHESTAGLLSRAGY